MNTSLHEPISVKHVYDSQKKRSQPTALFWTGRSYKVEKIGLHYTYRKGAVLFHVFTVDTGTLSFKIQLDTTNLFWSVEEISDGLPG